MTKESLPQEFKAVNVIHQGNSVGERDFSITGVRLHGQMKEL